MWWCDKPFLLNPPPPLTLPPPPRPQCMVMWAWWWYGMVSHFSLLDSCVSLGVAWEVNHFSPTDDHGDYLVLWWGQPLFPCGRSCKLCSGLRSATCSPIDESCRPCGKVNHFFSSGWSYGMCGWVSHCFPRVLLFSRFCPDSVRFHVSLFRFGMFLWLFVTTDGNKQRSLQNRASVLVSSSVFETSSFIYMNSIPHVNNSPQGSPLCNNQSGSCTFFNKHASTDYSAWMTNYSCHHCAHMSLASYTF